METEKKERKIFNLIAIICIILYCASLAPKVLQNDTYYTIKIGEYIYNNGISDLTTDLYSWHELPYTYPHWLYDLIMFVVYNFFGQTGIYVSTMILSALLGIAVYSLSTEKSKNEIISFVVTLGVMYLIKSFIAARAQLVTFILFVFEVFCIEKLLNTHKKRYAVFLVLIPLLIANLHCAVFPFYFVLFMPYIGEWILVALEDCDLDLRIFSLILKLCRKILRKDTLKEKLTEKIEKNKFSISERKRKREIIREKPYKLKVQKNKYILVLIIVMIIAAGTGFINPAGDGAYTYLYKTIKGNTTESINEHLPIVLAENKEFTITLVMFLIILVFSDTKIRLCDLFMLGGLTYLSIKSRRQVSMYALFCGPIFAKLVADMFEKYDAKTTKKLLKFFADWFGALVLICCFIIVSIRQIKPKLYEDAVDKNTYPVAASEWILENLDVENTKFYNEYNYGSYMLFKGIPVFIDSRCDLYTPEFNKDEKNDISGKDIFSDALNIASIAVDYNSKFEEYGVTHVITYSNAKLAMLIEKDDRYESIYSDGAFKIFKLKK